MLNRVDLMGRLTADPELRHTQSGVAVASFRIAVDRDFKDKDGQRGTDFLSVVCWRQTADFVSRYLRKGRMAVVTGRLQVRDYTDRDGVKRYVTEIVADSVYFGDSRKDEDAQRPAQEAGPGSAEQQWAELEDDDDDIPF